MGSDGDQVSYVVFRRCATASQEPRSLWRTPARSCGARQFSRALLEAEGAPQLSCAGRRYGVIARYLSDRAARPSR